MVEDDVQVQVCGTSQILQKASSPSPRVSKAAWVSNIISLILAALKAIFLLTVLIITIEMHFDHHFIIDFT